MTVKISPYVRRQLGIMVLLFFFGLWGVRTHTRTHSCMGVDREMDDINDDALQNFRELTMKYYPSP